MSIVSTSDFTMNQSLPIDELGSILTRYITKYEKVILKRVLGYDLYKDFIAGLAEVTPGEKWTNLRDGADYTYGDYTREFLGVKQMAVNYIYFKFIKENQQYSSSVGMKSINTENSQNADPAYKQVIAFNEMVDMNWTLCEFINAKNNEVADTYENFLPEEIGKVNVYNI